MTSTDTFPTASSLPPSFCILYEHPPYYNLSPLCALDDVRSSISQPEAGDDMDNLSCEFSPALDMVLRLHAPLQVRHARDVGW